MEKPAPTQHPIHELLGRRWSPRAFDERPVESDQLASLFEAARWAPSSNNEQPWRFIVGRKGASPVYDRLFACLKEGNQKWAHRAPVLMLSVAKLTFDDGSPNRHAYHDVGLAAENLVLQATALGLASHQMAGYHVEKVRSEFGIPADFDPVAMIAIGYPGDPVVLDDRLRQREMNPRERSPLAEFVYAEQWGRAAHL
jgi:nitroreductase